MLVKGLSQIIEDESLTFGSVWSEEKLVEVFDIVLPDVSSRNAQTIIKNVKKYEMDKMAAYTALNNQLLNLGKCLIKEKDSYRVPSIGEMHDYINRYYKSSNKKYLKADKLRKSFSNMFPVESKVVNDKANRTYTLRESQNKKYQPLA